MKVYKKVAFIFIIYLFLFAFTIPSHATNLNTLSSISTKAIELDTDNVISFPSYASNGEVNIKIDETKAGTGYSLYYQFISMPDSTFTAFENAVKQQKEEYDKMQADLKLKREALTAEEAKVKEAYTEYQNQYNLDPNSEETTTAKQNYEALLNAYNTHVAEYNALVSTYQAQLDALSKKITDLYTKYSDTNWTKAQNNVAKYNGLESGKKHFFLWVKLVKANNTAIYDCQVYTFTIPKIDTEESNNNTSTETPKKDTKPSTNDSTTAKKQLPKAGTSFMVLAVLVILSFIGYFSYKKYHTIDK